MKLPYLMLCLLTFSSFGQQIEIKSYRVSTDGTVNIDFLVKQNHSRREIYDILFYSSIDGYSTPIAYKINDVKPDELKKASFSGNEQLGEYEGQLQLKLVAQASTFPIKIDPIKKGLKMGKNASFSWSDYHESGPYEISLYQGLQLKSTLASGITSTQYTGKIPKSLDKGNYSILITPKNETLVSERYPVTLKKGTSPLLFVGVAALAGGGAFLAMPSPTESEDLPDPPGPPVEN